MSLGKINIIEEPLEHFGFRPPQKKAAETSVSRRLAASQARSKASGPRRHKIEGKPDKNQKKT